MQLQQSDEVKIRSTFYLLVYKAYFKQRYTKTYQVVPYRTILYLKLFILKASLDII